MQIQTTRFGIVDLNDKDVLTFTEGPLGFNELRTFVLLEDPHDEIFAWLQSCQNPQVAFPILEPELFTTGYRVTLNRNDQDGLKLTTDDKYRVFTIVTIPNDVTQMTANLKAPIVVNVRNRMAKQVIAPENDYPIKFPIFQELKRRMVQNHGQLNRPSAMPTGGVGDGANASESTMIVRLPMKPGGHTGLDA